VQGPWGNASGNAFLLGRFDEAMRSSTEALRLGSDSAIPLARTQFVRGEIREAIRADECGLTIEPDSTEMRRRLALALLMSEAPDHRHSAPIAASATRGDPMIQKPSATGPWMKGRDFAEALTVLPAEAFVLRVADDTERLSYCSSFPASARITGRKPGGWLANFHLGTLDPDRPDRRGATGSPVPFVNIRPVVLTSPEA